jgi:putative membrane protein
MAAEVSSHSSMVDTSTELALARTRAAYERTMMSWIRTATSLITFGFSVYKFFQLEAPARQLQNHLIGPRQFALALVSIGLLSLVIATIEYHHNIQTLQAPRVENQRSLAVIVAALISLLGILALAAMVIRR